MRIADPRGGRKAAAVELNEAASVGGAISTWWYGVDLELKHTVKLIDDPSTVSIFAITATTNGLSENFERCTDRCGFLSRTDLS